MMPQAKRSNAEDRYVSKIRAAFDAYREEHHEAVVEVKRYNPGSVRVRVIDPGFRGIDRVDRDTLIRPYLSALSGDVQAEISMLVLVTPEELKTSLANLEFEQPSRSMF